MSKACQSHYLARPVFGEEIMSFLILSFDDECKVVNSDIS